MRSAFHKHFVDFVHASQSHEGVKRRSKAAVSHIGLPDRPLCDVTVSS